MTGLVSCWSAGGLSGCLLGCLVAVMCDGQHPHSATLGNCSKRMWIFRDGVTEGLASACQWARLSAVCLTSILHAHHDFISFFDGLPRGGIVAALDERRS